MNDGLSVLRQFVEHADVALALVDTEMRYLAVSARWRADYGLGDVSLAGRSHYELFPHTAAERRAIHERCLAGATASADEERIIGRDGRPQWLAWSVQPWHTEVGAIGGLVLWSQDVTGRKAIADALESSEARYRGLAEQIPDGIVVADGSGRCTDANQAACAMVGYSRAELLTLSLPDLLADGERSRLPAQFAALKDGAIVRGEWRFRRKDGTTFAGELVGRQLADGRFQGVVRDVTGRNASSAAMHALEAQHRADADTLRALLATAAQGILAVDDQGIVRSANPALESMLGWAPHELVGQPHGRLIPTASRERHARLQQAYWTAARARPMGNGLDLVAVRKDGSTLPVEISLAPVSTAEGRTVFAFVTDISTRRHEENERAGHARELQRQAHLLRQLASELTLAEQRTREELAKMLHDHLQQLLFSASLRLQRLSTRLTDRGADEAEWADQARRELDAAIATTRSFVAELFPPMLHNAGLAAALTWLQGWAREKYGLTVSLTVDPAASLETRDIRTLVFQSVKELVFNAAKHSQAGHVAIDLQQTPDGFVRLTVADEGAGFDPADVLAPGRTKGTGFGLLAIRERLAGFGGRLDIAAAPGRGARVTLIVPREAASGQTGIDDAAPVAAAPPGDAAHPPDRSVKILIADDHALVRDGLRQLITDHPSLVVVGEARDGEEAVALARELQPDVIVMDVTMPKMDGVEATRRIHAQWPGIDILGLSTQERLAGLHAIEDAGAVGYFTKGDDAQRLLERLLQIHADIATGQSRAPRRGRTT